MIGRSNRRTWDAPVPGEELEGIFDRLNFFGNPEEMRENVDFV